MSSFTRFDAAVSVQFDPEASKVMGSEHWRLMTGFRYYVGAKDSSIYVDIPRNYITDFASVPWFVRSLVPRHGAHGQSAVLHDWLCEHLYVWKLVNGTPTKVTIKRKDVDKIFYESMAVSGVSVVRRTLIRIGVDGFRIVTNPTRATISRKKSELQTKYDIDDKIAAI